MLDKKQVRHSRRRKSSRVGFTGKLLKFVRSRLPVPETSRVPERGLGTSTNNWIENDAGATTRQMISTEAVEEVHEEEGRVPDNHGEPMGTQSEEKRHAGSGTPVGAG
jgi:hypothetical protein